MFSKIGRKKKKNYKKNSPCSWFIGLVPWSYPWLCLTRGYASFISEQRSTNGLSLIAGNLFQVWFNVYKVPSTTAVWMYHLNSIHALQGPRGSIKSSPMQRLAKTLRLDNEAQHGYCHSLWPSSEHSVVITTRNGRIQTSSSASRCPDSLMHAPWAGAKWRCTRGWSATWTGSHTLLAISTSIYQGILAVQ